MHANTTLTMFAILAGLALAGCQPAPDPEIAEDAVIGTDGQGRCFGRDTTPARIETVTEQIIVQPAVVSTDGTVQSPAAFRTVTRQRITRERREVEFETVCPQDLTPQFIASLQRALITRGYLRGQISGVMDTRTRNAVRAYQRQRGNHDTAILDIITARDFGLVELTTEQLDADA